MKVSKDNKKLLIKYDINGTDTLRDVTINISTAFDTIPLKTISGDLGHKVAPGKKKQIEWNMFQDGFNVANANIKLTLTAQDPYFTVTNLTVNPSYSNGFYLIGTLLGAKVGYIANWGYYLSSSFSLDNWDYSIPLTAGVSKYIFKPRNTAFHLYSGIGYDFECFSFVYEGGFLLRKRKLVYNIGIGVSDFDEVYPSVGLGVVF